MSNIKINSTNLNSCDIESKHGASWEEVLQLIIKKNEEVLLSGETKTNISTAIE